MTTPVAVSNPPLECPRCGYDLSGETERWTDACPIEGTCSECGLSISWGELISENNRRLPWFYEHASGLSIVALLATSLRLIRPWSFWRLVRLEYPASVPRAAVVTVFAFVFWTLTAGCIAMFHRAINLIYRISINDPEVSGHLGQVFARAAPVLDTRPDIGWGWQPDRLRWSPEPLAIIISCMVFTAPFTLLLMPVTLRRRSIRAVHLLRILLYALLNLPFAWLLGVGFYIALHGLRNIDDPFANSGWTVIGCLVVAVGWSWIFLLSVMRSYLRLDHAWRDATLLVVLSGLLGVFLTGGVIAIVDA
ncbi:MAG: hypothetical protein AAF138_07125 [Planctomycetota bacterium]